VLSFFQHVVELSGQDWAITMAPWYANGSIRFTEPAPPGYEMFAGRYVKLGLEHYPMSEADRVRLCCHYLDSGVRIPGADHKIRVLVTSKAEFAPSTGSEPELPPGWLQYVTIEGRYVGKKVRDLSDFDAAHCTETEDGWVLDRSEEPAIA
jgi:hypothetical protein